MFRTETAKPALVSAEDVNFYGGVQPNEDPHNLHSSRNIFGVFRWEVHVARM